MSIPMEGQVRGTKPSRADWAGRRARLAPGVRFGGGPGEVRPRLLDERIDRCGHGLRQRAGLRRRAP
jgi:hypothetical protein